MPEYTIRLRSMDEHPKQMAFVRSKAKRKIARCGRRGGKTTGVGVLAVERFLEGGRVLYGAPTQEQTDAFWFEIKRALAEPIAAGILYKNESEHLIEVPGTKRRIRAKTCWDADTLRGDYADLLILDEWQLMNEKAWELVGAPMLVDTNGDAAFLFTPPSLHSFRLSKAGDPRHAQELFRKAQLDQARWATFHWTSHDNPHISAEGLVEITTDMTSLAYRQEIMAEDVIDVPGALVKSAIFNNRPPMPALEDFDRIVVGVDPAATSGVASDETGIIVVGRTPDGKAYVLADRSVQVTPDRWARAVIQAAADFQANYIVAEQNNGGEMVRLTIRTADPNAVVKLVHASRGKAVRAEPIAALYEQGRLLHPVPLPRLEAEWTSWLPGAGPSPDRLDACVWAASELMLPVAGSLMRNVVFG